MTNHCSNFLFVCLESFILASCGAFAYALIVPSLFDICAGPSEAQPCAFFGVINFYYNNEKFGYWETTVLFIVIRVMVFVCACLVILSAFAAVRGYTCETCKILFVGIIFLTMTALIVLSIAYTVQWFESKLYGSSFLEPFPFHDLRPISENLSFPYFMGFLYPMILVFFFMGVLIAFEKREEGTQVQQFQN